MKATQVIIPEELRADRTSKMVMYGSTQTHSIGKKVDQRESQRFYTDREHHRQAAIILGMEFRALPTYKKDQYALRADVVREALTEDSKKGLIPFMLST